MMLREGVARAPAVSVSYRQSVSTSVISTQPELLQNSLSHFVAVIEVTHLTAIVGSLPVCC